MEDLLRVTPIKRDKQRVCVLRFKRETVIKGPVAITKGPVTITPTLKLVIKVTVGLVLLQLERLSLIALVSVNGTLQVNALMVISVTIIMAMQPQPL